MHKPIIGTIRDYSSGGFEHPRETPSTEEINDLRNQQLTRFADEAKAYGYVDFFSACYILAEDPGYDTFTLLKKIKIDTRWITRTKPLIPEDAGYAQRRGHWYFILLRLITGLNEGWKFDEDSDEKDPRKRNCSKYSTLKDIGASSLLPSYWDDPITGRLKQITDKEKRNNLHAHSYIDNSNGRRIVIPILIKLPDLKTWLEKYLELHLPERLFPIKNNSATMENSSANSEEREVVPDIAITKDSGLQWQNITVAVINETEIRFHPKTGHAVIRPYDQLGFKDGRSGKPISCWAVLTKCLQEERKIPYTVETRVRVEKIAQTLRKKFRTLFPNISGDPVPRTKATILISFPFK